MAIGQSWLADDDGYDTSTPYYHSSRAAISASPAPAAYKHADGKKIDGRRVLVDVERGRTVKGWHPRRLGGGLGGTRRGGADVNIKHSGRDDASRYDDRPIGGDRERGERPERPERGERRERSRERDRDKDKDKDRERRRSRSRERRRRTRSRERERERPVGAVEDSIGSTRRREREKERGAAGGEDSRSRERSRERKRRSRSRDRKRERGKGLEGEEVSQADGAAEGGERVLEEHEGEVGEGMEERKEKERDRRRSHRDRDRRRGDRDKDREHKRERGERDRGERREERQGSLRDDALPQDDLGNEDEGGAPPHMDEYSQDGMIDQQSVKSADGYGSSENGYKMEAPGEEY
ncbi:hypothetical protein KUCAC02_007977 [Chaenocephalus aceratus]|uniref:Uncharacterized protein n=1 Tax=Chaenocephalus aceratus TaxID=36190 RepID=A0ACB9X753_CHAAC|nr:hypothetical protein KUCAC02_007977 [Chaenocephalus aceratus]